MQIKHWFSISIDTFSLGIRVGRWISSPVSIVPQRQLVVYVDLLLDARCKMIAQPFKRQQVVVPVDSVQV